MLTHLNEQRHEFTFDEIYAHPVHGKTLRRYIAYANELRNTSANWLINSLRLTNYV